MHHEAGEGWVHVWVIYFRNHDVCSIFSVDAYFSDRRRLLNRIRPIAYMHKRAIDRSLDPPFKKYVFRAVNLSFLHRSEKILFHDEILQVCRKHVYVHHQENSEIFELFYYFLWFVYLTRSIWARVPKWISVKLVTLSL